MTGKLFSSPLNRRFPLASLFTGLLGLTLVTGCGGADSAPSSESTDVVTPPERSTPPAAEPGPSGQAPSGGLEMPPGGISETPQNGESTEESGGLEMPQDVRPPDSSSGQGAAEPNSSDDASAAQIRYGTWDEIEQIAKQPGRVTVVDLWSLACEPCLREFPGLVRLHREHGDAVRCLAVDLDFDGRQTRPPKYYEPKVSSFLDTVGAQFTTFISETPNEQVYEATDLVSIPAVLVYDAEGKLVKTFVDSGDTAGFSYEEDIIPFVTELAG